MGYLRTLAKALTGDGLILPSPVRSFLKGKPQPLALDTRERLADWCADHGYSDEQRQSLHNLIRTLVTRDNYLRAVASGSSRIDLDGVETGPVSDIERESAAKSLAAIAAKRVKPEPAMAPPPEPVPEPPGPSDAIQALASAFDAAITRPGKPVARAPVVEIRKRRPLSREVGDRQPPKRTEDASIIRPLSMSPPLPASAVRQAVERANNKRNALRMIRSISRRATTPHRRRAICLGSRGKRRACRRRKRSCKSRKAGGRTVDDMLTGIAPRAAWT